jgi:hypothetical protein
MPDLAQVETLAAHGLTMQQLADALGIHVSTLMGKKAQYEEFNEAIKRGKAKGIATVTAKLMDKVRSMDTACIIFYLKCQANWREINVTELTGADGKPLIPNVPIEFVGPSDPQSGELEDGVSMT